MSENNPLEMAGAAQEPARPEPNVETARQVFPVVFEKDYMDFRPQAENEVEESIAPKSSLAPASVAQQASPTGLEDVSEEDLENPAPPSAEKDKSQTISQPTEGGSQTSLPVTSAGKTKPTAKT